MFWESEWNREKRGKEVWKEKKIHVPVNVLPLEWFELSYECKRVIFKNDALNFCCVWSDIKGSLKQPLLWFMVSTSVQLFTERNGIVGEFHGYIFCENRM